MDRRMAQSKNGKGSNYEKMLHQQNQAKNKYMQPHVQRFLPDRNEFPSLTEVSEQNVHGKVDYNYYKTNFTYSEKLKVPLQKQRCAENSHVGKFGNMQKHIPENKIPGMSSQNITLQSKVSTVINKKAPEKSNVQNCSKNSCSVNQNNSDLKTPRSAKKSNIWFDALESENCESTQIGVSVSQAPVNSCTTDNAKVINESFQVKIKAQNTVKNFSAAHDTLESNSESNTKKKKKKRKAKIKRQADLQTGKITILSAETLSKIRNQSNALNTHKIKNIETNINDAEEYPELGKAVIHKCNKENVSSSSAANKKYLKETDCQNSVLPQFSCSSPIEQIADISKTNHDNKTNDGTVHVKDEGKVTVHANSPITVSFLDMLLTSKSKSKEKKTEVSPSVDLAPSEVKPKKNTGVLKNVHQPHNLLDSSSPIVKRGKEREKPKPKKLSHMKKIILMDRKIRKEQYLQLQQCLNKNENPNEELGNSVEEKECHFSEGEAVESLETLDDDSVKNDGIRASSMENVEEEKNSSNEKPFLSHLMVEGESVQKESNAIVPEKNKYSKDKKEICIDSPDSEYQYLSSYENEKNGIDKCNLKDNLYINDFTIKSACSYDNSQENEVLKLKEPGIQSDIENQIGTHFNAAEKGIECIKYQSDILKPIDGSLKNSNQSMSYNSQLVGPIGIDSFDSIADSSESCTEHNSDELVGNFSDEEKMQAAKIVIHTRNFREYCNHLISKDIDDTVLVLLEDLIRFQDRMHQKDPVKARIKRRLIYGIKEVKKYIKLKKLKCIIMATDIENVATEGGLNDVLYAIKSSAADHHIPCVYALSRKSLGKVCHKPVPVSCIGIFSYEGSEANFKKMLELQCESMNDYNEILNKLASKLSNNVIYKLLWARKAAPETLHNMRTQILREMFLPDRIQEQESIATNAKM